MPVARRPLLESLKVADRPIYHYTSSAGLIGLVQTARLRASEATSLNDLAEVRSGWEKIQHWLGAQADCAAMDLLRGLAAEPSYARHEVFMVCCSTSGDDANQWRLYGDEARGYAVELDPDAALVVVSDSPSPPPAKPGFFSRFDDLATVTPWIHVLYTEDDFEDVMNELATVFEAQFDGLEAVTDEDEAEAGWEALRDEAYDNLATVAHLVKAPGFSGENEVRAVATMAWQRAHICYRPSTHGVVGYVDLTNQPEDMGRERVLRPAHAGEQVPTRLSIKSVRLAPLLLPEHANTVEGMLRKHGFDEAVVKASDVELR